MDLAIQLKNHPLLRFLQDIFTKMLPVTEIVLPQLASNVPAFLAKLWKMVDDPDTDHLIAWGDLGNSFVILNQADFSQSLLPYYYKHSNMASFVRQLNMYGFHKVVGVEAGGLKSEKDQEMEFAHKFFLRGQELLLNHIKRKVANSRVNPLAPVGGGGDGAAAFAPSIKTEKVTEVLNEVSQLKDKQEDMDSKLDTMKKENEALWREVITLRQKHSNQQKIVNKLIHFLMGCLQGGIHPGHAVKRRFQQPLAIEARGAKQQRLDGSTIPQATASGAATGTSTPSGAGPLIFEMSPEDGINLLTQNMGKTNEEVTITVTSPKPQTPRQEVPMSPLSQAMQAVDPCLVNPAISLATPQNAAAAAANAANSANFNISSLIANSPQGSTGFTSGPTGNSPGKSNPTRPTLQREISKEDFDAETFHMQTEIDHLKDILSGQITLDSNLISNLFNPNEPLYFAGKDPLSSIAPSPPPQQKLPLELESSQYVAGKYIPDEPPSLFELADIDGAEDELVMPPPGSGLPKEQTDSYSLETPLITVESLDTNPLLAQITKKKNRKKF